MIVIVIIIIIILGYITTWCLYTSAISLVPLGNWDGQTFLLIIIIIVIIIAHVLINIVLVRHISIFYSRPTFFISDIF